MPMLAHIPIPPIVHIEGKYRTPHGLVSIFVAFRRTYLMEHAATVEKNARSSSHSKSRQAVFAATAQVAFLSDQCTRLGSQLGQKPIQVRANLVILLLLNGRSTLVAADAITTASKGTFKCRLRKVNDWEIDSHPWSP
jgi:predicted house-cleaning NTP pyrophosphatase (Maf/HAM1 superfamily)